MSDELIPPIIIDILADSEGALAALDEMQARIDELAGQMDASTADIAGAFDEQGAAAERAAAVVSGASDETAGAIDRVTAAVGDSSAAVSASADDQAAAYERVAEAAGASADVQGEAAARVAEAQSTVAGAADVSSTDQVAAQERVAAAAAESAGTQTGAAGEIQGAQDELAEANTVSTSVQANNWRRLAVIMNSVGLDTAALEARMAGLDESAGGAGAIDRMAASAGLSRNEFLGLAGGITLVAGASVDLGAKMQDATTEVAQAGQISEDAAGRITSAFNSTAFSTQFSGIAMAKAYAGVAGELGETEGHALGAGGALLFMKSSADLAQATGGQLANTTSDLASVMQAFGIDTRGSAGAASALFVAAQRTGTGVDQLATMLARTKSRLGELAPSLADTSALLVDMAKQGMTGRAAVSALPQVFLALLKPMSDAEKANQALKVATDALPPSLRGVAQAAAESGAGLTSANNTLSASQSALVDQYVKASAAAKVANASSAAMEQQLGMTGDKTIDLQSVIGHLSDQMKGLSSTQVVAKLTADGFGGSAKALAAIIEGGTAGYEDARQATSDQTAAQVASEKAAHDLGVELKVLLAGMEDLGTDIGTVLVPPLTDVVHVGEDVLDWVVHTEPALIALGAVVTATLGPAVLGFAVGAASEFVASMAEMAAGAVDMGARLLMQGPVFAEVDADAEGTASAWSGMAASIQAASARVTTAFTTVGAAAGEMAEESEAQLSLFDAAVVESGATVAEVAPEMDASFSEMLGPIGLVAGAIGLLVGAFGGLGGSEESEAQASAKVTSAKEAETSAIETANSAVLTAASGYLGIASAQENYRQSQDEATAALKRYGESSLEYQSALTNERQAHLAISQAVAQETSETTQMSAAEQKAVDATRAHVTAIQQKIAVTQSDIATVKQAISWGDLNAKTVKALTDLESQLADQEKQHTDALKDLTAQQDTATDSELNRQRAIETGTQLTQDEIQRTQALGSVFSSLPRSVQTKLAADSTDALEKISGLISALQPVVGSAKVVHILADTSSAQAAIASLGASLSSLESEGLAQGAAFGKSLEAGARGALESKSPSKVFYRIGTDVGKGMIDGMDSMSSAVAAAAKRMSSAASVSTANTTAAGQAASDANTLAGDRAAAIAQAIADAAQLKADITGETGLSGAALTAQLAKVALDRVTQSSDAAINAAKEHVDKITSSTDALVAKAQKRVDADADASALTQAKAAVQLAAAQAVQERQMAAANKALQNAQDEATINEARAQALVTTSQAASQVSGSSGAFTPYGLLTEGPGGTNLYGGGTLPYQPPGASNTSNTSVVQNITTATQSPQQLAQELAALLGPYLTTAAA